MDEDFVKRAEKFCECAYKAVALIARSDFAERQRFKRTGITITCPCCGREIKF